MHGIGCDVYGGVALPESGLINYRNFEGFCSPLIGTVISTIGTWLIFTDGRADLWAIPMIVSIWIFTFFEWLRFLFERVEVHDQLIMWFDCLNRPKVRCVLTGTETRRWVRRLRGYVVIDTQCGPIYIVGNFKDPSNVLDRFEEQSLF